MLIDCFTFFNELDMLECRLEYLYDRVDRFVLVEADITHSGKTKPLYFKENQERFAKYLDKISHVVVNIDPAEYDWQHDQSKNFNNASWQVENRQRNGILEGIKDLPDSAVIMVSDLDEIPNKDALDRAIRLLDHKIVVYLETKQFFYNLNQHLVERWPATAITRNSTFTKKYTQPQALRNGKDRGFKVLNGGWHLTYFGDVAAIRNKILNFAHQEYNTPQFTDPAWIEQRLKTGEEPYGRPFPMVKASLNEFSEEFLKCFNRYLPKKESNTIEHYADTVQGFFRAGDMLFYREIVEQAPQQGHFVEVGSYKGRSSSFMAVEIANSGKQIKFDCVDTWEGSPEHQEGSSMADSDVINKTMYDVFIENMKPVEGYYTARRMTSLEAAQTYEDNSLDFVFIDADHQYESVRQDIIAWFPKVRPGGIIAGHDYHWTAPGVMHAANEIFGFVRSVADCWWHRKQ